MPLILSSLARSRPLYSQSAVGLFASAVMSGAMFGTLSSVLWVRRVSWRRTAVAAELVATAGGLGLVVAVAMDGRVILSFRRRLIYFV
jgi:hypothetical protein